MNSPLQSYIDVICPNCIHNQECDHNKFITNKYNTTINTKCLSYEFNNPKFKK